MSSPFSLPNFKSNLMVAMSQSNWINWTHQSVWRSITMAFSKPSHYDDVTFYTNWSNKLPSAVLMATDTKVLFKSRMTSLVWRWQQDKTECFYTVVVFLISVKYYIIYIIISVISVKYLTVLGFRYHHYYILSSNIIKYMVSILL